MCTSKQKSKKPAGTPGNFNYVFTYTKDDGTKTEIKVTSGNDNEAKQLAELECEDLKIKSAIQKIIIDDFNENLIVLLNTVYSNDQTIVVSFWGSCQWFSIPVLTIQSISKISYGICEGRQYPLVEIIIRESSKEIQNDLIRLKWNLINGIEEIKLLKFNEIKSILTTRELSGAQWVARFPGSNSISSLSSPFRESVQNFHSALIAASASVSISATLRPRERAYLMRTCYDIANNIITPANAGTLAGVNIEWVHPTLQASINAAKAMVTGYGIVYQPAYPTKHSDGTAIDMNINWTGTLNVRKSDGTMKSIASTPRTNANLELQEVANTYNIYKLASDPPHWSDNGH